MSSRIISVITRYLKRYIPSGINPKQLIESRRYGRMLSALAYYTTRMMSRMRMGRSQKEATLQAIMDASATTGLNIRGIVCEHSSYTGRAMFLPEGLFAVYSGYKGTNNSIWCPWFRNDSMTSGFVAKGYRMVLYRDNVGSQTYTMGSPGSYNLSWHSFNDVMSVIKIELDSISPQQYKQVQQERDAYKSQSEYNQSQVAKQSARVGELQSTVSDMGKTIQDKENELQQSKELEAELETQINGLQEQNEVLIEDSAEEKMKTQLATLETFESMHGSIERTNLFATIGLSATIVLLVVSSYSLIQN